MARKGTMEFTEDLMSRNIRTEFLQFAGATISHGSTENVASAPSLNTFSSSLTLPTGSVEDVSSYSLDPDCGIQPLAAMQTPTAPTQFANTRHLASGYEPYPLEIPGRLPDMRLSQRTRKGHRKSRQGCYNCKKRKIKCQESLPACDNCIRKELECTYPLVKVPSDLRNMEISGPLVPVKLQTTPIFSMADMRLFHHFLCVAYPHLPVGNESVWTSRIPAIAHHYEFLMHAILGLAASHLTVTTRADYSSLALSHRVKAIQGFNEALSKTSRSGSDGDSLLAAVYAITFQSTYLSDGLRDFLTTMRGCALVSIQLAQEGVPISFNITLEEHHEFMKSRLHDLPVIANEFIKGAQDSLGALAPLLTQGDANHTAYKALVDCMSAVEAGGPQAYYKFIAIHNALFSLGHQSFQYFIDPSNEIGLLVLAHFVALELILSPIYSREWKGRSMSVPMNGIVHWVTKIQEELSDSMQPYLAWPKSIVALVHQGLKEERIAPWLKEVIFKLT